jgi:hypothetical protein
MKKLLLLLFLGAQSLFAQKVNEQIYKEVDVTGSEMTLEVYNILGSIKVEGYAGNKILITVDKEITGITNDKEPFELGIEKKDNVVQVFTKAPYDSRNGSRNKSQQNIHLKYSIKVPHDIHLKLSTINSGDIEVAGVNGTIHARNINGSIRATEVKMPSDLQTINGEINITYASNHLNGSVCKTLNGSIHVSCPAETSANIQLKTMNGHYYTDFSEEEMGRTQAVIPDKGKESGRSKLNSETHITLGKGECHMKFETMNGSIYIQKKM